MRTLTEILFIVFTMSLFSTALADTKGDGYIYAEGVVYFEKELSPNQMRRMAILDAYRYLAEEVDTIHVTSESTVKNLRDLDDQVNSKVEAALRGAKIVSVNRESDGSFHAVVKLPVYGDSRSLASAVLQEDVHLEEFPKPKFTNIIAEVSYTGLIIDCRGLSLSSAIAPTIKSVTGVKVYAYNNVGYQNAVHNGMVEYSGKIDSTRAGRTPLVVKAVEISDKCDVIVSDEDADKILSVNQSSNILANCAVVLMR